MQAGRTGRTVIQDRAGQAAEVQEPIYSRAVGADTGGSVLSYP